jgi:secreted trypsin-like serine protease
MIYSTRSDHYFQIGVVSGGVTNCGNTDVPDIYVRLDHPEIANFIKGTKETQGCELNMHSIP